MSPRVSVIMIFLNEERFLEEAVQSVLDQSYEDWNLVLVDDGSRDASTDIAMGHTRLEPGRIRYVCHSGRINRGMSASRNLGLAHATGEMIGFLDADDVWLPDKLSEQLEIMDREPEAGLVYGRTEIWNSWNETSVNPDFFYDLGVEPDRLYRPPRLFELLLENKAQTPTSCNALMRRTLFDRVGGFEESFRGMFEDQIFFAKALVDAPAYVDSRVWARYRQRPDSCSARSMAAREDTRARRRFLQWLDEYVRSRYGTDSQVRLAVRRELQRTRRRPARAILRRLIKRGSRA